MEWLIPALLMAVGVLTLAFECVLRRFMAKHGDESKPEGYYSLHEISGRFARRQPVSWAMIAFGVFWSITNLL